MRLTNVLCMDDLLDGNIPSSRFKVRCKIYTDQGYNLFPRIQV